MSKLDLGYDENGVYRRLDDARALRIHRQMYNTMITLSSSVEDQGWEHGW